MDVTDTNCIVNTGHTTVSVVNVTPPLAIAKDIEVSLDGSGNTAITAAMVDQGSSAPNGPLRLSVTPNTFTCQHVGANFVTLTALDSHPISGLTATDVATVTVLDRTPPLTATRHITVQLNSQGQVTVDPAQLDDGSSDACGIATFSLSKTSFTTDDIGLNSLLLSVTDINGNQTNANVFVTVVAADPPISGSRFVYLLSLIHI